MQMTGMFLAIGGYLKANNDTRTNSKKESGKGEDHGMDITSIEKQLDRYYEQQRNFLLQGKLLEVKLLEMRNKLN